MKAVLPTKWPCFVVLTPIGAPELTYTKDGSLSLIVLFRRPESVEGEPIEFWNPVSLGSFAKTMALSKLSFDLENGTMFTISTEEFLRQALLDPGAN